MIKAVISHKGLTKRIANRVGERIDMTAELTYEELQDTGVIHSEFGPLRAADQLGYRIESAFRTGMESDLRIVSPATAITYSIDHFVELRRSDRPSGLQSGGPSYAV